MIVSPLKALITPPLLVNAVPVRPSVPPEIRLPPALFTTPAEVIVSPWAPDSPPPELVSRLPMVRSSVPPETTPPFCEASSSPVTLMANCPVPP